MDTVSEKLGYTEPGGHIQTPHLPQSSQSVSTHSPSEDNYDMTFGLTAPIIDFVGELSNEPKCFEHPLSKILRGPIPPSSPGTKFRWIHIPVNHMGWAEVNAENGTDYG